MRNKTIAEKILSNHAKKDLKAGDFAVCNVDFCFGQDGTSNIIIERIKELGFKDLALKNRACLVIDHSSPSPNQGVSAIHNRMRAFAAGHGLMLYDIGCGICHQVILESGGILPGDLVLGADSHTCTYGALGALSTGVGSTDLSIVLASGKNWFRVPQTIKIIVKGRLKKGVVAKDVILYIISLLGSGGATYKAIEFCGPVIDDLDMDGRFTIANMVVELGAKCGFMPVDKTTHVWLKSRVKKKISPVSSDKDAEYSDIIEIDVTKLTPRIAKPHSVDNGASVKEVEGTKIDEAFLGTCTNGRLKDLEMAAKILKGKKVAKSVKFIVAPASREIFLEALKKGIIEIFIQAGAAVVNPGCGPCVGTHQGVPSDNEVVISAANRNFKGRMGNPSAFIYLASPLTVAASAIKGEITDPRRFLK
ncbi:MAG: 3-isopropylmalate dehydratase large subunit [Candidatus Omnitrophota bacterium]